MCAIAGLNLSFVTSPAAMNKNELAKVLGASLNYAEVRGFAGYDPYDALNTSWKWLKKGKWPPVLAIQVMKRNPINLRSLMGIKPVQNAKGLGLFLEALALLEKQNPGTYREQIQELLLALKSNATPGYSGTCWGYPFDWASPVKVLPAGSPTIVATGFVAKGLYEAASCGDFPLAEELLKGIELFILNDLPRFEDETGLCISYSTVKKDCCYNATMLAAGYFARLYKLSGDEEHRTLATRIAEFVVQRQQPDGRWDYSVDLDTGKVRVQTDFHQGFILDSLIETMQYLGERPKPWVDALTHGADFYFEQQFAINGRSYFRLPRRFPADVHHQAQGIITACRLRNMGRDESDRAHRMTAWALKHLYDGKGSFYYRYFAWFTDKTRYMRWGQAWMTLALALYHTSYAQDQPE